jgi:hypothetical protein
VLKFGQLAGPVESGIRRVRLTDEPRRLLRQLSRPGTAAVGGRAAECGGMAAVTICGATVAAAWVESGADRCTTTAINQRYWRR